MPNYEALVQEFTERYPHLILQMSGPWPVDDRPDSSSWICNFKNATFGYREVHAGSSGETMELALREGLEFLERSHDNTMIHDFDADRRRAAPSPMTPTGR